MQTFIDLMNMTRFLAPGEEDDSGSVARVQRQRDADGERVRRPVARQRPQRGRGARAAVASALRRRSESLRCRTSC